MHFTPEQRDAWVAGTKDSPFNIWLRAQVNRRDGSLDLPRLHNLAAEYGIDPARYNDLNPGQQRMNIGNRLRSIVPQHVYEASTQPIAPTKISLPTALEVGRMTSAVTFVRRAIGSWLPVKSEEETSALIGVSTRELLQRYGAILDELRRRDIVRTGNAPLGDYAEHLFAAAYQWELSGNSASGHDATDPVVGTKVQIKARRLRTGAPGERQLGTLRRLPDGNFDVLAAILFASDYSVFRAALIPHALVLARSVHIKHVNGWRFILDDTVWNLPGVIDVTDKLVETAQNL